jgi:nitric oxide reductase activation protein
MTSLIVLVFKLINFSIFCALAYYLFIKKLKPFAQQRMHEQACERARYHVYVQEHTQQLQARLEQVRQQEILKQTLMEKALLWQKSVLDYHKAIEQQQELYKESLVKLMLHKQQNLQHHYTIAEAMPQALTELEQKARSYFAHHDAASHYTATVINHLKKRLP